mmetsp:Transcript_10509/g.15384  ORF Transcript_10509/g.15384 Transcript_10509/m.15384 type:complete len:196 (-) Transcript_10509:96-683(-)|eukprot:CAMPEP_0195514790 /NCGR_PEP_ID=MMETSP0794_2-20130614/6070_1 /TAXON_ID=515487 /ORGANISM="Stephanopyxis turris, Strain CCMP 815" /LENGTH=195 /DNA_ID=CAMNT_0040643109 /DNA_START=207 /DNA_END=794 /DNA_ORIENTATION=+
MTNRLSFLVVLLGTFQHAAALSMSASNNNNPANSRRAFVKNAGVIAGSAVVSLGAPLVSQAATTKEIITTDKGVKFAITKDLAKGDKQVVPQKGDIVAIDYTGYLTNGQIFDSTHAEGKGNNLLFKLGNGAVIAGLEDVVSYMAVGMKVQAIIPPEMAFGDKGICLQDKPDECLIKPGSTLVYDVFLKKSSIPPP